METDMIITAIGQSPDVSFIEKEASRRLAELEVTRWNTIEADPATMQTKIPYVFVAGDMATGPSLVVEAIGGGRRAARAIHQYLMGEAVCAEPLELDKKDVPLLLLDHVEGVMPKPRVKMAEVPVSDRLDSFVEVDLVLSEKEALYESDRCLYCGLTCYNTDGLTSDGPLVAEERTTQKAA